MLKITESERKRIANEVRKIADQIEGEVVDVLRFEQIGFTVKTSGFSKDEQTERHFSGLQEINIALLKRDVERVND